MIFGYKWSFASIPTLCDNIGKTAATLNSSMTKIEDLIPKIKNQFEELKNLTPELNKLKVQVAELKEYKPKLQDLYHEKRETVLEKNSSITFDVIKLLDELDKAIADLKRITFDTDTLIYKEDKILTNFAKKIKELKEDEKLVHELINRINEIKENMKTMTRRLFESSKAEEKDIFSKSIERVAKTKIPISEQIKHLGIEIDSIGRVLEHLKIDDIDEIVKSSEEELSLLRKVELEVMIAIKKLEQDLISLKNRFYLLEDDVEEKLRKRLDISENKFNKIKTSITKNAENLFEDIRIVEKIPSKFFG